MSCVFLRGVSIKDIIRFKSDINILQIKRYYPSCENLLKNNCLKKLTNDTAKPIFTVSPRDRKTELFVTINNLRVTEKDRLETPFSKIPCVWCRLKVNWRSDEHVTGVLASAFSIKINEEWRYPSKAYACSDQCHLAYLLIDYTPQQEERIELLKTNYRSRTGCELRPSPDWLLLKENGGSLTKELFFSKRFEYVGEGRLLMHGSRMVYRVEEIMGHRHIPETVEYSGI